MAREKNNNGPTHLQLLKTMVKNSPKDDEGHKTLLIVKTILKEYLEKIEVRAANKSFNISDDDVLFTSVVCIKLNDLKEILKELEYSIEKE